MTVIDATNLILGRMATNIAKRAILGEKIDVVNCENAIITGERSVVLAKYQRKIKLGAALTGPYYQRMPDRLVRRVIRGMLPYKRETGRKAFESVMCYVGVPESLKSHKVETIKEADASRLKTLKFVTIKDVCKHLGAMK
jgi:large subunit ribosomal protein L13